jgi:two-component system, LytTR family, sensor kinase
MARGSPALTRVCPERAGTNTRLVGQISGRYVGDMAASALRAIGLRRVWAVAFAAFAVPGSLSAFETYMFLRRSDQPQPLWRAAGQELLPWLVFAALTPMIWWLGEVVRIRRGSWGTWARALAVHIPAAALTGAAYAATAAATEHAFLPQPSDPPYFELASNWLLGALPAEALSYFTILGAGYGISLWLQLRERELASAKLTAQLAEARLAALRMQLHPHFLFNSLNAITVLVRDYDTAGATRMLTLLAELLRQALRVDGRDHVSLDEELGFTRRYLAIEQVRFSDRLSVRYVVDEQLLSAAVPCFVIQPLVENALRHGLAPRARGGTLEVGARAAGDRLELWVRDDGVGLSTVAAHPSSGVGLANTRARLAQLYGDAALLDIRDDTDGGVNATISLPRVTVSVAELPA